ncbi:hypothetical protein LOK49_LG04G03040 [Camellia lanceoleosa]|uniref:Uncharacterized protein n=1 Tax=Camellia lanceoleosa TaxID=1840588 RepID=A0ACC0HZ03_9ERIC|nr:hypothetical protein LOK49_LG04G03040 [Camellia lanceoleosa]
MGSSRSSVSMSLVVVMSMMVFVLSTALDMWTDEKSGVGRRSEEEVMSIYESWVVKHGKSYNGEAMAVGEKERRFEIFKENLRFIEEHNAENRTYKVGLNKFADLSNEEYRSMYLGGTKAGTRRRPSRAKITDRYAPRLNEALPDSVDWRKEGAVVQVKDQGSCGMCFILSHIHNIALGLFFYFLFFKLR